MIAAHLLCLIASCILWVLHMCAVFPHFCCHLVSLVHSELAVMINPSHPSPSCLSMMCLCVSTDFTVLSNTLIPLNMSAFTELPVYILTCLTLSGPVKTCCEMLENILIFCVFLSMDLTKMSVVTPLSLNCCLLFQDEIALDFQEFLLKW